MINDEDLINRFKEIEVTIIYIDTDGDRCIVSDKMKYVSANNCATVSKEYTNAVLSELEKWIDEYKDPNESSNIFRLARLLKDKIKSLKK